MQYAAQLDEADPLRSHRNRFVFPRTAAGDPVVYLCGNSLGLMPRSVPDAVNQELEAWGTLGVAGHFETDHPWFAYHEVFKETGALLVGAEPGEVVMMNSLTVNLHLMMASFYQPTKDRYKILMEDSAFPSDQYAVQSHLRFRGLDPVNAIVTVRPSNGHTMTGDDFARTFSDHGSTVALAMVGGVNFSTGQYYPLEEITRLGRQAGCIVGFDLAHAAGNVPLRLHDWGVDFAVWCSYKYLNAGPGAVAGCFVHDRHGRDSSRVRLAGWWGNEPTTRFKMSPTFEPQSGAAGWQLSNPPILSMAPLRVSLEIFAEVGMSALRQKSQQLTGYLCDLLSGLQTDAVRVITPLDPSARGCQLSIEVKTESTRVVDALLERGIVIDHRPPNLMRVAPVPLYNSFSDVYRFAEALAEVLNVKLDGNRAS